MDENEIHDIEDLVEPMAGARAEREPLPWGAILLGIWAVLLVIFSVQNADPATISFLAWDWEMPIAILVIVTAGVTLVLSGLGFAFYRRRRRRRREVRRAPESDR